VGRALDLLGIDAGVVKRWKDDAPRKTRLPRTR